MVMPPSGKIETGNFMHDNVIRFYKVLLPKDYYEKAAFPLVVFLHMGGSDAQSDMDYTGFNSDANTAGFMVVWPDAFGNYWNSGVGDIPGYPQINVDDVGFIDALIDTLDKNYKININKIYIGGFGNGNRMAHRLGCRLNHRITAIGGVTGSPTYSTITNCNISHNLPVLHIHGTNDDYCPILGDSTQMPIDSTLRFWANTNTCLQTDTVLLAHLDPSDSTRVQKISFTNTSDNVSVVFYKVINGGCNWPGAPDMYSWEGTKTTDIDANIELLNFFQQYD